MPTLAERLDAKVDAALTAQEDGDPVSALELMIQAQTLLSVIPDSKMEEEGLSYRPDDIAGVISNLRRECNRKSSSGVVSMPLKRTRG